MTITIITATWNSEATLRDTFESVLSQDYQDYEYIIIDGGSQDKTIDIIHEYEPKFGGRLRWVSEKDKGIYDAMNKGIEMATGQVIGILNSDDFYNSTDILSTVASEIKKVDAVYGDVHYVSPRNLGKCVRYYSSRSFRPWKMRFGFMPAHPSFYCKSDIYKKYGNFDLDFRTAGDFEFLLRVMYLNRIQAKYIAKDFVAMRTGGETSSGFRSYLKSYRDRKKTFKKHGLYFNFVMASVLYITRIRDIILTKLNFINKI